MKNTIGITNFRHIGLYGYRRDILFQFCKLSPSLLEKVEKLEQLRALENGIPILTVKVDYHGISVDTRNDLLIVNDIIGSEDN
jgi:3-deoxy-manno-octulosonate cytidylyltransferase (CMP-KDO synthetase)